MTYDDSFKKIAVFVDVQNLYFSAWTLYQGRVRYGKLLMDIVHGRRLLFANAYVVGDQERQKNFTLALRKYGFSIRMKETLKRDDRDIKLDWDVGIACDIAKFLRGATEVNTIVIVTGDGDFVDLVELIKHWGLEVEVWGFKDATSRDLMRAVESSSGYFQITDEYVFDPADRMADKADEDEDEEGKAWSDVVENMTEEESNGNK